jgi:uncharacterized membrane protein YcjF (UPF0283 family)
MLATFWSWSSWNAWWSLAASIVVVGGGIWWMVEDGDKLLEIYRTKRRNHLKRKFAPVLHELTRNGGSPDAQIADGTVADIAARTESKVDGLLAVVENIHEDLKETTAALHRHLGEHDATSKMTVVR